MKKKICWNCGWYMIFMGDHWHCEHCGVSMKDKQIREILEANYGIPVYSDKEGTNHYINDVVISQLKSLFKVDEERIGNEINKWLHKHNQQHLEYEDLASAIAKEING